MTAKVRVIYSTYKHKQKTSIPMIVCAIIIITCNDYCKTQLREETLVVFSAHTAPENFSLKVRNDYIANYPPRETWRRENYSL